jgi:hypothetical protein
MKPFVHKLNASHFLFPDTIEKQKMENKQNNAHKRKRKPPNSVQAKRSRNDSLVSTSDEECLQSASMHAASHHSSDEDESSVSENIQCFISCQTYVVERPSIQNSMQFFPQ